MAFSSGFAEQFQLRSKTVEVFQDEGFGCETALLGLSEESLQELKKTSS